MEPPQDGIIVNRSDQEAEAARFFGRGQGADLVDYLRVLETQFGPFEYIHITLYTAGRSRHMQTTIEIWGMPNSQEQSWYLTHMGVERQLTQRQINVFRGVFSRC
jgi:hypothetical protein